MDIATQAAASVIYDSATCGGGSWYSAALQSDLIQVTSHLRAILKAQRLAKQYAHMYGMPWPVEEVDARSGIEAYREARWGAEWGQIAKQLHYRDAQEAEQHARMCAQTQGRKWPPQTTSKAMTAYEIRASTFATWPQIAKRLQTTTSYLSHAVRTYAIERGLEWPIPPPSATAARQKYRNTGRRAYHMHADRRLPWVEITEHLGVSRPFAQQKAGEYAQEQGLPWPVFLPDSREGRAYELRLSGLGWEEIAEHEGCKCNAVKERARRYAVAKGLQWPMPVRPVRRAYSAKAEAAYRMGYVEGRTWKEVATALGYASCQAAMNSGKVFAQRFGLPYHTQKRNQGARDRSRQRRSYEMRSEDPTMTWAEISTALGYNGDRSAHASAQRYAQRNGLPWPI